MALGRGFTANHDDLAGAHGFDNLELSEQANGGIKLIGVAGDHADEAVVLEVNGLTIVVIDDLEDLSALIGACGDFNEDHFLHDGILVTVFLTVNDVDELVHLHDDLMQTFWMTADADGHAAEAWITALGNDERFDVETTAAKDLADTAKNTRFVVHVHTEGVDVDDVRLRAGLVVGGGGDAITHGFEGLQVELT